VAAFTSHSIVSPEVKLVTVSVSHRYNDFAQLWKKLCAGIVDKRVLNLPGKQWFSTFFQRWKNENFIKLRREHLQSWLNEVIPLIPFMSANAVKELKAFFAPSFRPTTV